MLDGLGWVPDGPGWVLVGFRVVPDGSGWVTGGFRMGSKYKYFARILKDLATWAIRNVATLGPPCGHILKI